MRPIADLQKTNAEFPAAASRSVPDADPVNGNILKVENRVFSVLDSAGNSRMTCSLEKAIQATSGKVNNPVARTEATRVIAHPWGNLALVCGGTWVVWLEWEANGKEHIGTTAKGTVRED